MLELNDIKGVEIGLEMDQVKTFTFAHSIVNTSSLSYREEDDDGIKASMLPKYFVYVRDDGASLDNIKTVGDTSHPVNLAVVTDVTEENELFAEDSPAWNNANNLLDDGKISIEKVVGIDTHFGDEETPELINVENEKISIPIPDGSDTFALTSIVINSIDATDPEAPVSAPVEGSPFEYSANSVDNITLCIKKNNNNEWEIEYNKSKIPSLVIGESPYVLSVNGNNLEITSNEVDDQDQPVTFENKNGTITFKPVLSEEIKKQENIAKISFGLDGKNKSHIVMPAVLTKTSKFVNGLKIAVKYCVNEILFITIGTLKPSSGQVDVNDILINDYIDTVVDTENNDSENTRLLKAISSLGQDNIENVKCLAINKSERHLSIINWETNESELKDLHPLENGEPVENIIPGSVILSVSTENPFDGDKSVSEQTEEGIIIVTDHSVKEVVDEDGMTHAIFDENGITNNGMLNRFRSVSFTEQDTEEEKIYFEKEAFSVGKVFYNTGVIELNNAVPVMAGTSPALYCDASGMDNLKFNIKNKGTDGNKYSLKIIKDHTENNGDVIYNVSLMLNDTELDSVTCSSNPEGSVVNVTDSSGNVIDMEVPYIGTLDHDTFYASFVNVDTETLKLLHEMTYNFNGGTDGVDGITASDYIGYKNEAGTAGAWLFDDVKYPAQMWPSLGYTDKEFYMAAQDIAWNRKDTTCVWDVPKGYSKKTAIEYREDEPVPSQWWTELYYNWCNDVYNGSIVELPPSYYVTKNSLASYKVNGTWYPVAGKERGTIDAASVINQVPAQVDRDEFITHNINPIYDTGNQGIQIYGNETLNAQYTDLSAAHIARTLTYIRSKVDAYTEILKFELNDVVLWRTWIDYVKSKILETIKAARGLQWYRVSMGNDTTTATELANRIVRGVVELQFNQDAEIFRLDYVCYSSAADNSTF